MDRRSFSRRRWLRLSRPFWRRPCPDSPYPAAPVKIIAPVAPGGGVDLVARTVAERLQKALGQPFIVDNMSGGGGVIAARGDDTGAADGYTLMLGYVATHGTNPAMRNIPYDAVKDFTAIAMVAWHAERWLVGRWCAGAASAQPVALLA